MFDGGNLRRENVEGGVCGRLAQDGWGLREREEKQLNGEGFKHKRHFRV